MVSLDSIDGIKKIDKSHVLESIIKLPDQIDQTWKEIKKSKFSNECSLAKNVVIAGMGGSALGGRIVDSLIQDRSRVPIEVFTEYHLPNYVNNDSLVILSSYSGDTEETLSDANEALKRKAKIFAITTNGKLEKIIKENDLDAYIFKPKANPSGQPRMALGYSITAILTILSICQYIHLSDEEINKVIENLKQLISQFGVSNPSEKNLAKTMATKIKDKIPLLVASEHLVGSAHEFKNQLNETAKNFSVLFDLPELNHHLMEGLKNPAEAKEYLSFIFFESSLYSPRVVKRYPLTQEVVTKNEVNYLKYRLSGNRKIDQVFELIVFGLFTSFYLAMLYEIDPSKIPWVDYFKARLKS